MLRVALVLVMLAAVYGSVVQQCASGGDLPLSVAVEGCEAPPCRLPQLQDAVIHYTFMAPRNVSSLRATATVLLSLGGISLPIGYDLGEAADACSGLAAGCPVAAGQPVHYTLRLPIETFFPVGVVAQFELQLADDSGALVCSRVPVQIAAPAVTDSLV